MLDIDPGEPYRSERLLDLQRALQSTPWFAGVTVEIDRDPANPARVPVRVAVLERPVGRRGRLRRLRHRRGRCAASCRCGYRNVFGRGYDMLSALQADKTKQLGYADFYLPPGTLGLPLLGAVATKDSVGVLAENTSNQGLDTRRGAVAAYRQFFYEKVELRVRPHVPGGAEAAGRRREDAQPRARAHRRAHLAPRGRRARPEARRRPQPASSPAGRRRSCPTRTS